jgi:hypothetical protein
MNPPFCSKSNLASKHNADARQNINISHEDELPEEFNFVKNINKRNNERNMNLITTAEKCSQ